MSEPEQLSSAGGHEHRSSPLEPLRILWERKWIVLTALILCVLVTEAIALTSQKQYTAVSKVLFRDPGFARTLFGSDLFETGSDPERAATTNIEVLKSPAVGDRVTRRLDLARRGPVVSEVVEVSASENSDVIDITAITDNPRMSADIANAYAREYITYQREEDRNKVRDAQRVVERNIATSSPAERGGLIESLKNLKVLESLQTGNAEVVALAKPDPVASAPQPRQNGLIAAVVGLLFGAALAFLADFLDRRLKTQEATERAFGHGVIVSIPRGALADKRTGRLVGPNAEPYRMLRESLRFLEVAREHRCILVTSPDAGEGKTTVATNLARSVAAGGKRVILIEADLRRPAVVSQIGDPQQVSNGGHTMGLSGGLVTHAPLSELLIDSREDRGLRILPSGPLPPNPADLLRTPRVGELLEEARSLADMVIIDAPPVLPVSDTQVLLDLDRIDGVLLIARAYQTRRDRARETSRILERSGQSVLGVVLTAVRAQAEDYYYDSRTYANRAEWPEVSDREPAVTRQP